MKHQYQESNLKNNERLEGMTGNETPTEIRNFKKRKQGKKEF